MTENNPLVGTWHLRLCEGRSIDGKVSQPFGEHPSGMLMYDADGNMAVILMQSYRRSFASEDVVQASKEEILAGFAEFEAYGGTYTLNAAEGTVIHHIRQARFPNWIGTDQLRHYSLQGDTLVLKSTPILRDGKEWVFTLDWYRESPE